VQETHQARWTHLRPQLTGSASGDSNVGDSILFSLLRQERTDFWTARLTADQQHPHRLWQSLDQLMGRGRAPPSFIERVCPLSTTISLTTRLLAFGPPSTAGAAEGCQSTRHTVNSSQPKIV